MPELEVSSKGPCSRRRHLKFTWDAKHVQIIYKLQQILIVIIQIKIGYTGLISKPWVVQSYRSLKRRLEVVRVFENWSETFQIWGKELLEDVY